MRKFRVVVNGNTYEVELEELGEGTAPAAAPVAAAPAAAPVAPAPSPAAASKPAAAPAAKKPTAAPQGTEIIKAPMPGTILDVKVKPGDTVKRGQVLMVLEAMKMENEIMASRDCTMVTVDVAKGTQVGSGDLLATFK